MKENLNMTDILKICLKKWQITAIFIVVFAVGAYMYSTFVIDPMYKSSGQIYIKNSNVTEEISGNVTASALSAGEKLGITFIEMLKNDTFLSKVKNMGNFDLSTGAIRSMLVFDQPNDTAIINVRVNSADPKQAHLLVQEILRHAPAYLEGEIPKTSVDVLQEGKLETTPYSPNVMRNILIGIFLGGVLGIIASLCLEFFNKKIEGSEELEESFGYPILGEIPNLRGGRGSGVY